MLFKARNGLHSDLILAEEVLFLGRNSQYFHISCYVARTLVNCFANADGIRIFVMLFNCKEMFSSDIFFTIFLLMG